MRHAQPKVEERAELVTPSVGDTIFVSNRSDGNGKLERCRGSVETVSRVYLDGTVCVGYGDVYAVERSSTGNAKWQTVWPRKQQKED